MQALLWFRRVMWLGIAANFALAVPTLLAPAGMIDFVGLPPATPIMWPQFAALLLILLSLFYMPAGIDPVRYRLVALFTLVSRLAGVVFFVGFQPAEYHMFGYFDFVFLVPQALLLFAAGRAPGSADQPMTSKAWSKRKRLIVLAMLLIFGGVGALFVYSRFFREEPAPYFASAEEHFLYGSVGTEAEQGLPYWIWLVLPRIFPEHLPRPGGYASMGIVGKDGHELPVGFSKVTVGFPRVGINCAVCHAASFRARAQDVPTIYPAAASHQTGEQEYLRFLIACGNDPRFTADVILGEIAKNTRLSLIDRMLYRFAIIPGTRRALRRLAGTNAWMLSRPDWGRGRIDPFNTVKYGILRQPMDDTIGNSDMMPLWNLKRRENTAYHWDGLSVSLREVVQSSALGDGATRKWVERDYARWNETDPNRMSSLRRVMDYIGDLQAPKYPLPIDSTLAAAGAATYKTHCAACHDPGGAQTGKVIPLSEIKTDRHRLDMWTASAADAYNKYGEGYSWKFSNFRKSEGYTAVPLDGVWLTGPYLHNGSVPTLADLLEAPEARPTKFWRGYDVFDAERVGYVSTGPEAQRVGTLLDVSRPGNSNAGHTYGTTLSPQEKRALVEYLKTR